MGVRILTWGDEADSGDGCTTLCKCLMPLNGMLKDDKVVHLMYILYIFIFMHILPHQKYIIQKTQK